MTRPLNILSTLALASAATLAVACAGDVEDPCYRNPDSCAAGAVESHRFVITEVSFPQTISESRSVGLDLDGDFEVDNDLGTILPGLRQAAEFDLSKILADAIATGEVILLVDVQASDLDNAAGVVGRVVVGKNPSVEPCADENDTICGRHLVSGTRFEVDDDAIFDAAVLGDITDSSFAGGPNGIRIEIDLEEIASVPAFILDGEGVRAEARMTASGGLSGVIGGGVRAEQIEDAILPALVQTAHDTCQPHEDPNVCCVPGTVGAELITQFDTEPFDCKLTTAELMDSQLVSSMLAPTLDLLNGSGTFAESGDGTLDSMSLGARFEAVPADF